MPARSSLDFETIFVCAFHCAGNFSGIIGTNDHLRKSRNVEIVRLDPGDVRTAARDMVTLKASIADTLYARLESESRV